MCTKPFSQTKNKGKLFLVAKSSGPLLARMPLKRNAISISILEGKGLNTPNEL